MHTKISKLSYVWYFIFFGGVALFIMSFKYPSPIHNEYVNNIAKSAWTIILLLLLFPQFREKVLFRNKKIKEYLDPD